MFTKRFSSGAMIAVSAVAAASFLHVQPAAASQPCVFQKYAPTAVSQYTIDADLEYGAYDVLSGAQLYIPAREGLTRQWLELSIERALAQDPKTQSSDVACQLPDAKKLQVKVTSAGNGFWVQLMTSDPKGAAKLVQWASQVVQEHQHAQQRAAAAAPSKS